MSNSEQYARLFGHQHSEETERLGALTATLDPESFTTIERLGPEPGWRCLEIGAGTGTVAAWLSARCPEGSVVATDVETSLLAGLDLPNLEVVRHDVTTDDFPAGSFDLIHARWVFSHLPEREAALERVVEWLAPGGWLVVEDVSDFVVDSSPDPLFRKTAKAFFDLARLFHGMDARWSRGFPVPLARTGLDSLGFSVSCPPVGPGTSMARFISLSISRGRAGMVPHHMTDEEFEQMQEMLGGSDFWDLGLSNITAWGRRPISDVARPRTPLS